MTTTASTPDCLAALRPLALDEDEQRQADLDAERAVLSLIRRSLAARDRVNRRVQPRQQQEGTTR